MLTSMHRYVKTHMDCVYVILDSFIVVRWHIKVNVPCSISPNQPAPTAAVRLFCQALEQKLKG